MRLQRLEVTDFGPYRGPQRYDFAAQPGVELLWGENGRGKTSLLNAIRYALFGVVLGRGSAQMDLATVGNRNEDAHEATPFKTTLSFEHDGKTYKLTRAYGISDGDGGVRERVSMVRDGDVLGPDEREQELARLLPEQIARFFLFDGELLQEYEQLLNPGSDVGDKLKAAIERILGVPVLTQARDDVAAALKRARTLQAKAAQKDKATRDLGNSLQVAQDLAEAARENVEALTEQVENLQTDANDVEKTLTGSARYQKLLASRNERRLEVERRQKRSDERNEDLAARAGEIWRAVVAPLVAEHLTELERLDDDLSERYRRAVTAQQEALAATTGQCPTCKQKVTATAAEHLQTREPAEDPAALQVEMLTLRSRRSALRAVGGYPDLITRLEKEADQARVDLSDAQGQLSDVEAELADAPPGTLEAVTTVVVQLAGLTASLTNTRGRLAEARKDASAKELAVATLSDRLRRSGAASTGSEDRKVELLSQLQALLIAAVTDFRDRLRETVEEEATKIFRLLSAEPDYDRLRINDSYGLSILFADGSPVINRSSGYEHVVALSLIAALQRCSPMSGPIITDSPFGRLDRTHKRHVLATLPQISDQVMLLVHDEELDRQMALGLLRNGELVAEHHLRRLSGRHTQIERGAPA